MITELHAKEIAEMEKTATHEETPNWQAFYKTMLDIGLESIEGLPADLIEWIRLESQSSELLSIDDDREDFVECFLESPSLAVDLAFERFVETVRGALRDLPFARASEGWAFSAVTGKRISWGDSVEQIRDSLGGWERRALIAAAESAAKA